MLLPTSEMWRGHSEIFSRIKVRPELILDMFIGKYSSFGSAMSSSRDNIQGEELLISKFLSEWARKRKNRQQLSRRIICRRNQINAQQTINYLRSKRSKFSWRYSMPRTLRKPVTKLRPKKHLCSVINYYVIRPIYISSPDNHWYAL